MKTLKLFLFIALFAVSYAYAEDSFNYGYDSPYAEGSISLGTILRNAQSIKSNTAKEEKGLIPYASLRMRLGIGDIFRPEILIEESGGFNFKGKGLSENKSAKSYNNYYIKVPFGFGIPFFNYDSSLSFDFRYSVYASKVTLSKGVLVNNSIWNPGSKFLAASSDMVFRLYFNTPIAKDPTFFEYSYFGFFYSQHVQPRTVTAPSLNSDLPDMLLSTSVKTGGIFYDMRKDTPLKGLNFNIALYLGYGSASANDSISYIGNYKIGNTKNIASIYADAGLHYRYISNSNLGFELNAGISYYTATQFFDEKDNSKYNLDLGGDLRFILSASFLFGI